MRGIFIDAENYTVSAVETDGSLKELQKFVGGFITIAGEFPNGDHLYVNDEGLINGTRMGFDIGLHQPFAGNGIILGDDGKGDEAPAATTLSEVINKLTWVIF